MSLDVHVSNDKVCIGNCSLNSFAYADDVSLVCTTAPGLQRLINICADYARKWRFKFGIKKTMCMIMSGQNKLSGEPVWYLDGLQIQNVSNIEILGVIFSKNDELHVKKRTEKCQRIFYA